MFERAIENTIGYYDFDPLQLSLVVLKDKGPTVRFQYFSGRGETIIDLPLRATKIEGLENSLKNALSGKSPVKLTFKSRNNYMLHLPRFDNTKSEYVDGGFAMLFARFLPVSGIRCRATHNSATKFLIDLRKAMDHPAI